MNPVQDAELDALLTKAMPDRADMIRDGVKLDASLEEIVFTNDGVKFIPKKTVK